MPYSASRRRWYLLGLVAALLVGVGVYLLSRPAVVGDELRWGGDASGGEPYLIEKPDGEPGGFEGEIATYLAGKLGRPPKFVQRTWSQLPQDLERGDVDMVLNGYEWFPEREKVMASTIPYFAYRLSLIVRRDGDIGDWGDLVAKPGRKKRRLGVLKDSAAHRYLEKTYGNAIEIQAYDEEGVTGVMTQVVGKTLDATVQDTTAANWYLETQPAHYRDLRTTGEAILPSEHSYFVIFVRKSDDELREQLNDALRQCMRDGTMKRILEKYGLWDADQVGLLDAGREWPPVEARRRPPPPPLTWFARQLGRASLITIELAALSFPLAMALGLGLAIGRLYGPWWLTWPLGAYVELIRGTPLLLQLSVIYYFLPLVGVRLDAFTACVLGLALNYAAYEAEIYRAGLLSVPRGQMEAALSLGMSSSTALWRILVPQAVRTVIPPVTNDFIALFKDTSVCSVIAVAELTARYRSFATNNPALILELGLMAACLYLAMSYPLSLLSRRLERAHQRVQG
jgi:polar amino acid transport system substrate-binding protein